jgi:hypothetical protein
LQANGNVVKARVIAMLAGDMAQLEIVGQKVEVSTPQALEAGATISVAINRTGQSLELVIQPDANNSRPAPAPQPISGPGRDHITPIKAFSSLQPLAASVEDWVLTAQAAINEAVLSSESNFQNANLPPAQPSPHLTTPAAYLVAASASQAQLQAEIRAHYEWDAGLSAPDLAEDQGLGPPSSASEASQWNCIGRWPRSLASY